MTTSMRILIATIATMTVLAFFLYPSVGIGLAFGLSMSAAYIAAVVVALAIGYFFGFVMFRDAKKELSRPKVVSLS